MSLNSYHHQNGNYVQISHDRHVFILNSTKRKYVTKATNSNLCYITKFRDPNLSGADVAPFSSDFRTSWCC